MAAPFLDFGNGYAEAVKIRYSYAELPADTEGGKVAPFDKRAHGLAGA